MFIYAASRGIVHGDTGHAEVRQGVQFLRLRDAIMVLVLPEAKPPEDGVPVIDDPVAIVIVLG
jgi:hypothetical protein